MCIFANEGSPKSKRSRKETPLKIQKYKEIHVSGKNLEKKFSATTPNIHFRAFKPSYTLLQHLSLHAPQTHQSMNKLLSTLRFKGYRGWFGHKQGDKP